MPKITKEFVHDGIDTTCGTMYPIKTRTSDAMDVMYTHKGATDAFYADLKELLAQCETLSPAFNDEEKSFTIFDAKFYVRCLNTVNAPNYASADKEYCVRPFFFKEGFEYRNPVKDLTSDMTSVGAINGVPCNSLSCSYEDNAFYNQMHYNDNFVQGNIRNFNGVIFFYHSRYDNNLYTNGDTQDNLNYFNNWSNPGFRYPGTQYARYGYDSHATIIPYDNKTGLCYTIEIYYNSNWVQVLYKSHKGEKFSLGLFFVGKFTNPDTNEVEELLFTQQDGSVEPGKHVVLDNGTYMSNFLHAGYTQWWDGGTVHKTTKVRYTNSIQTGGNTSEYFASQITNQYLMIFRKGSLQTVLEELGMRNIFHATNANALLNSSTCKSSADNDFQLYNYSLKDILVPIAQSNFGYLVPLVQKFYKIPFVVCNGMVTFDNIIYGQEQLSENKMPAYQTFDSDLVYDIGEESYYCPFTTYRNIHSYNGSVKILLKL